MQHNTGNCPTGKRQHIFSGINNWQRFCYISPFSIFISSRYFSGRGLLDIGKINKTGNFPGMVNAAFKFDIVDFFATSYFRMSSGCTGLLILAILIG